MIIDIDSGDINLLEEYYHPPIYASALCGWTNRIWHIPLIHQIDDKEFLEDQPEMIEIPLNGIGIWTVTIESDIDTSILNFEYQTAYTPLDWSGLTLILKIIGMVLQILK